MNDPLTQIITTSDATPSLTTHSSTDIAPFEGNISSATKVTEGTTDGLTFFLLATVILLCLYFTRRFANDSIFKWLDTGIGAGFISIFGAISAAQISIFSGQIQAQFLEQRLGMEMLFAIGSILVFGCAVYIKEIHQSSRIREKESAMQLQWKKQEERLTSLPPNSVLASISETTIYARVLESSSKQTDENVSVLLKRLCKLAEEWDGRSKEGGFYNANLMITFEKDKIQNLRTLKQTQKLKADEQGLLDSIESSPFFLFDDNLESRIETCDGILWCVKQYSTGLHESDAGSTKQVIAQDHPAIVFPYVINKQDGAKQQPLLFGAPEALVSKIQIHTNNTVNSATQFLKQLEKENSFFKKSYRDAVTKYYNDHKGSILSIPLLNKSVVVAVVNIYREECDILMNGDRAQNFYHLVKPICDSIVKCLINDHHLKNVVDDSQRRIAGSK
ncbi:hypothetical protein ACLINW_002277 [Vibrio parahaemolyticus]|uniref:hypothetical protein n=1 Tax=Vibrio harveyi group TaxID=717610 RepID=UPI000BAEE095|nr:MULTISPECIES: hypothetical protein [Vibrio harveyi group]EJG1724417.1 hypothetical protein [Vibrio parahaemolyticus]EJG1739510.1 hypothetical protein [Vibrio parahaemolyticus]EJG1751856.1 hypothetical protein [Vibrio parahaemolyticus]EJG1755505.1 hypothetical protein [Vibrio parahaemolyticus]MCR9908962.1 hypothetical protein [Vibrio campbellii]